MNVPVPHDFEPMYAHGEAPWDIGRPQTAFLDAAKRGLIGRSVLDVGCGTGEHALLAAEQGATVLGLDISPTAIGLARDKARRRGVSATFRVSDLTTDPDPTLDGKFDTVLDCGTFHVLNNAARVPYLRNIHTYTKLGSRYLMVCFSEKAPGRSGPRRLTPESIECAFATNWQMASIEETTIETTMPGVSVPGWFTVLERVH